MSDLRITQTNSATDSKGETFGLEGNLLVWILISAFITLIFFIAFPWWIAVMPVVLVTLYVFLLKNKRPPRYDLDFFDGLLQGPHWYVRPRRWKHPYHAVDAADAAAAQAEADRQSQYAAAANERFNPDFETEPSTEAADSQTAPA